MTQEEDKHLCVCTDVDRQLGEYIDGKNCRRHPNSTGTHGPRRFSLLPPPRVVELVMGPHCGAGRERVTCRWGDAAMPQPCTLT